MRSLVWLAVMLGVLGPVWAQPLVTYLLAWETAAPALLFDVEQCDNKHAQKEGCVFGLVVTLPGVVRQWETGPLRHSERVCWRVRPLAPPAVYPWSNIVCV